MDANNMNFDFDFSGANNMDFKNNVEWVTPKKGRPRAKINKLKFEFYIVAGCNQKKAAELFNVSDTTIQTWMRAKYGDKSFKEIRQEIIKKYNEKLKNKEREFDYE